MKIPSFRSIKKTFEEEQIGEFDQTSEYIFTNDRVLIPNFVRRILRMKKVVPDRRERRYGRIKALIFHYISAPMVIISTALVYAVLSNFSTLVVYFNTNVYLNALIISLMIFGILKVFHNSYLIFRSACFLRLMERIVGQDEITEDDVRKLRRTLEKKAWLLNTSSMDHAIDNIGKFGHPNFNDHHARLIKSKLGYRVGSNRANVNFISGVLVMLGLLGTFIGLLTTIDSVGEALNSMANLGGDGGEIGMEQMTAFIGSLAAPLGGMGLAFSSSLFGLSGSLMIGLFIHLAGAPQNFFIENVSRWLDDRIVKFDPSKIKDKPKEGEKADDKAEGKDKKEVKLPPPKPTDNDLKEWLAGFVYLSTQTHKKIGALSESIARVGDEVSSATVEIKGMSASQNDVVIASNEINQNVTNLTERVDSIVGGVSQIMTSANAIGQVMKDIDTNGKQISEYLPQITNSIEGVASDNKQLTKIIHQDIAALEQHLVTYGQKVDDNLPLVQSIELSLNSIHEVQEQLLNYQVEEGDQEHPALNELNQAVSILGQTNQALLQARSSDVESTQGALKTMEGALSDLENVQKKLSDDVGVFMQSYSSSVEIGRDSGDALVKRKKKSWFSVGRKNTK
ncbi:MAG: hypothetical protein ACRBCK_03170 [Alphaproteobacteria bacterium]